MTAAEEPIPPNDRRLLKFVHELAKLIASSSTLHSILDGILRMTMDLFGTDEGCIRLAEPEEPGSITRTKQRHVQPGVEAGSWPSAISRVVEGYLSMRGEPLASSDLLHDPRFPGLHGLESRIGSLLAVPLLADGRFHGMLAVTHGAGRRWTEDEIDLLAIVGAHSAGAIERARLKLVEEANRRAAEERRLLEQEMQQARAIQRSMLPARPLAAGPWEIRGRVVPARQVGGDAFDYFELPNGRAAVMVADVSGKGYAAALVMNLVQGFVRAHCDGTLPVAEALRLVNRHAAESPHGKFITMVYAEIDLVHRRLRYCNAGHNYPLIRRGDGTLVELSTGGLPLGMLEDGAYAEEVCPFGPQDALLLYSDGITEAVDTRQECFGTDRLRSVWSSLGAASSAAVIDRVFQDVESFRGGQEQNDDMTVVVVGRPGRS